MDAPTIFLRGAPAETALVVAAAGFAACCILSDDRAVLGGARRSPTVSTGPSTAAPLAPDALWQSTCVKESRVCGGAEFVLAATFAWA